MKRIKQKKPSSGASRAAAILATVLLTAGSASAKSAKKAALAPAKGVAAVPASQFLDSLGANSALAERGENLEKTIECARYLGLRWFRAGIEGDMPLSVFTELHRKAGVRFSWSPGSGGSNLPKLIETARKVAAAGALLAFEGPNEPNNWRITYQGQEGGGNLSWMPVAKLQADLYRAVKSDPVLKKYPVWSITEGGAEVDNVGLQYLTVPKGANASMPDGTKFADCANVHNYVYHPNSPLPMDNKTWNASDPSSACKVDGLYGEYGVTWGRHYRGYSAAEIEKLPRVTTETGATIDGPVTEEIHALNLLSLYLDQFKRGWNHTAVYLLRDRVDEAGNQRFGFYRPDYSPRLAATYLHNLTTILADEGASKKPGALDYSIPNPPPTVHDLLLRKSGGAFELVVWDERVKGSDAVTVRFGGTHPAAKIFDPTKGTAAIRTLRQVRSIPLTLSDHPLVIEIPGS